MSITFAVLFWLGISAAHNVHANGITGFDDPALQNAIQVWLEDNDKESLPAIAAMAVEGNIAARLLLARIEDTDRAPTDYVSNLSRKERVDLFRSTSGKGVFRPSWLKSEMQAGNQVASALLKSSALEVNIEAIQTLYEIGEPEAAYDLIRQVAGNGTPEDKEELEKFLPERSELMPYLRALRTPVTGFTPGHAALDQIMAGDKPRQPDEILADIENDTDAAAIFVEYGYHTGGQSMDFDQTNSYYDALASWIDSTPATTPISILCHQYCDYGQVKSCAVTSFGLVGGYYKAIRYDSPIESFIEQSRYVSSDRAAGMLLRRISLVKSAAGTPLISNQDIYQKSACLAKAVTGIRASAN